MHYLRYWALRRQPFLFPRDDDFFAGAAQREALAGVSYFVGSDQSLSLLVCPPKNGLSWLLGHIRQMRGFGDRATELVLTEGRHSKPQQVLSQLLAGMGIPPATANLNGQIAQAVDSLRRQEMRLVWMMDCPGLDAVKIADRLAKQHNNLSILVGCRRLDARRVVLDLGHCPPRIDLNPLSISDAHQYVRFSLQKVDGDPACISDNTIVRLHELSGGMIGHLAFAAESALALAASERLKRVTPEIVEAVARQHRRAA